MAELREQGGLMAVMNRYRGQRAYKHLSWNWVDMGERSLLLGSIDQGNTLHQDQWTGRSCFGILMANATTMEF